MHWTNVKSIRGLGKYSGKHSGECSGMQTTAPMVK